MAIGTVSESPEKVAPTKTPSYCHACFRDILPVGKSPDPRYCRGCYDFLCKEAENNPPMRKVGWIPRGKHKRQALKSKIRPRKNGDGRKGGSVILSTVEIKRPKRQRKTKTVPTAEARGRKQLPLPQDRIKQLATAGMGSKKIANRIKTEFGIAVSYRTIARAVNGERRKRQLELPIAK